MAFDPSILRSLSPLPHVARNLPLHFADPDQNRLIHEMLRKIASLGSIQLVSQVVGTLGVALAIVLTERIGLATLLNQTIDFVRPPGK